MTIKKISGKKEAVKLEDLCKLKNISFYESNDDRCEKCSGYDKTCEFYVSTNTMKNKERMMREL